MNIEQMLALHDIREHEAAIREREAANHVRMRHPDIEQTYDAPITALQHYFDRGWLIDVGIWMYG
jgi:hypothetical protein